MRKHLVRVRSAAPSETDDAVRANQIYGAPYDPALGVVESRGLLSLVDQKRKGQAALGDELGVALGGLGIHAEDQRVFLLCSGPAVAEFAQLPAANRGVVAGIEDQHHVVAAQRAKRDHVAGLIGEREIGRGRAGQKWIRKEPIEHVPRPEAVGAFPDFYCSCSCGTSTLKLYPKPRTLRMKAGPPSCSIF